MKGVVNKGIQELVEAKFGAEAWDKVKEWANCEEPFFLASEDYPDQMTLDLVDAVSRISGLSRKEVLVEFGKFWVPNTGAGSYPVFFKLAGSTARGFLLSMARVHRQVTKNISNAHPPDFEYEELPGGRLLMRYRSERKLCALLRGLILGVGIYFGEELEVKEVACLEEGAHQCAMEVSFHGP